MTYLEMEERKKCCKSIPTNHLITLCEVFDDYKSFCDDLEKLIKSKSSRNLVNKVYHAMQGNLSIVPSKYKDFIEKHKRTIEIMNKYRCLSNLTILSYDAMGNRIRNLDEEYFYQYIQEHKKDIETIKSVVLKIKKLGFINIYFHENLDFTEYEFEYSISPFSNFSFLENIEVNPIHVDSLIRYKTNDSCYCLNLNIYRFENCQKLSEYGRDILLNSLIFDPDRLPNEITIESTIDVIKKLAEDKKVEHQDIKDSVDLSIATIDLTGCFENLNEVYKRIAKLKDNSKLVNILSQMQDTLTQLQSCEKEFENHIIDSYEDITPETIEKAKKLYLDKRNVDD